MGTRGLLDIVLAVPHDEVGVGQLVHVDLHGEHLGSVVLENVHEGGECWRQPPRFRLSR